MKKSKMHSQFNLNSKTEDFTALCKTLYYNHINLARLYAFACGIQKPAANISKKIRTSEDNKCLLWTVQNLKTQMAEVETELTHLIKR